MDNYVNSNSLNIHQQVTVLVGLQHGDEGKGKISYCLSEDNNYDCFVRFNGGPNAGHTIYVNNKKIILHQVPCGIMRNVPCLISSGCVVDLNKLDEEITILKNNGIDVRNNLHIAYNCHVITKTSIEEDSRTNIIGTTNSGIGPTYSKKALRIGTRMYDLENKNNYNLVDPYEFLNKYSNIFMEGAQGYELDIDYGDYPYVTSSSCLSGAIFINGIRPSITPRVIGVCKLYDTYVGTKQFQPNHPIFNKLQVVGNEYGATTGRSRQCNWLNLSNLIEAIKTNDVNKIYINKCDIIEELNVYCLYYRNIVYNFKTIQEMKAYIKDIIVENTKLKRENIFFSHNKHCI